MIFSQPGFPPTWEQNGGKAPGFFFPSSNKKAALNQALWASSLLLAADIILTITLELSFETLGTLGLLVLIRTFLHFILELEITGRWPWQHHTEAADDPDL